ncbi:nitroreductase family protein [Thiovibrio sp. JS02]
MTPIATTIDSEKCSGCGLCLTVCPDDAFSLLAGKAAITGVRCLACGHCAAICPSGAVRVAGITADLGFATFRADQHWLPFGQGDTGQLVRLMLSRRSCRNYAEKEVEKELLEDLVRIGTTAPSGTNSQGWTFTILPGREAVAALGDRIADYFKRLNRLAANPIVRNVLRFFGKPALGNYYRRYHRTIADGLTEWEARGRDRLFHGAPAAIIVAAAPEASCPVEDGMLASQNILLAAHTMGLGSCLIGFAVAAMENERTIKEAVGIPGQERVIAVIALGYPAEPYRRLTGRKAVTPRFFRG